MNILFVNISVPGSAGDTNQWQYVIQGLEERGHKVTLVVSDGNPFYFDYAKSKIYEPVRQKLIESNGKLTKIKGMNILPIHCVSSRFGLYCPSASKIASKIIKNYDVVYILNWYYHLAFVFSEICYKTNIPVIIAGMGSLQNKAKNLKKSRKKILDILYTKKMFSNADGLHSVGELETKEYIKNGVNQKKIFRIDHGVVLENFVVKNKTNIFKRIGIVSNDPYIVTVSRLDPKKGIEILIEGFNKIVQKFPKIKLIVVGTGMEDYVNNIKKMVERLNLNKNIIFTGFVTDAEKIELLESAKIFVTMSHSDVHPLAAIEALTMGVPTIVTKDSDFPEIDEYNAGITINAEPDSMYNAALKLLEEKNIQIISDNAKRLIEEKFLVKYKIKEYEHMFLTLVMKKKCN